MCCRIENIEERENGNIQYPPRNWFKSTKIIMMQQPILKMHWERFKAHVDLDKVTAARLLEPYTPDSISELTLLSEGCANTNYKVSFKNDRLPVVIRIYVRDDSALEREVAIHKLLVGKVPTPQHLFSDVTRSNYPYSYSVIEWLRGQSMRDIILTKDAKSISECAYDAGRYLAELIKIKFPYGGFFDENFIVQPFTKEMEYLFFVQNILRDSVVKESLGSDLLHKISNLVEHHTDLLPAKDPANLTHGDYDSSNMLIIETNNQWNISGILDWEFTFAGTYLLDIGLMLRYSHKLPTCYEESFIKAIEEYSEPLPITWKRQAKLMDLLCLLQLAHYNPPLERPKINKDVVSLMMDIIENWDSYPH